MSEFPKVSNADRQGRIGVDTLALALASMGLIWRETPRADVGIDGQVEYVDRKGRATARLVAAQVKSGDSYFADPVEEGWRVYLEKKHLLYWERFPMPVLLVLHSPDRNALFWVDARQLLRSGVAGSMIVVPSDNILNSEVRDQLFAHIGVSDMPFMDDIQALLKMMATKRTQNTGFYMSYLELFVGGLTNITRSLYFGMDLAMTLAENYLARIDSEFGVGLGSEEHDFIFSYIEFLVSQHLADVDFSDCLIDWLDRRMVPHFMAPLTSRGRLLVRVISSLEDEFRNSGVLTSDGYGRVTQETFVRMEFSPYSYYRFKLISDFQTRILEQMP